MKFQPARVSKYALASADGHNSGLTEQCSQKIDGVGDLGRGRLSGNLCQSTSELAACRGGGDEVGCDNQRVCVAQANNLGTQTSYTRLGGHLKKQPSGDLLDIEFTGYSC